MDRQFYRYFALLEKALERELQPSLDPVARVRLTLLDIYISKTNKRKLMFFVCVGSPESATELYEIGYLLPVPNYSTLYNTGEETLPADGPTFFKVAVAPGTARAKMVETAARLGFSTWLSEIRRITAMRTELGRYVQEHPDDKDKKKLFSTVKKILIYWESVRSITHNSLDRAGLSFSRTSSGRTASASASDSVSNASSSPSEPRRMTRSSHGSRRSSVRRHSSAKSYHTRRSSPRTSDPKPRGNSDPRRRKTKSNTR